MKRLFGFLLAVLLTIQISAQTKYPKVVIETSMGKITVMLYDKTPQHSENFIKLVNEGFYNNQLFHRVIKDFMIQSGDDKSINAAPNAMLGRGGKSYTIEAEFVPEYYHKKGALSAARQGDNVNPEKRSSGSQFYIVQGKPTPIETLNAMKDQGIHKNLTTEKINHYSTVGGTPHLDNGYTVFGEVVEGLEIIDQIAAVQTNAMDRPLVDIKILKTYTVK